MRNDKHLYEPAELQLVFLDSQDVITTSGDMEFDGGTTIPGGGWV